MQALHPALQNHQYSLQLKIEPGLDSKERAEICSVCNYFQFTSMENRLRLLYCDINLLMIGKILYAAILCAVKVGGKKFFKLNTQKNLSDHISF